VDDLIEGMIRVMHTEIDFTGPVNLGNPQEFSMLELAKDILALTGSKSKLEFKPLPEDDPKQRCPDISLAKKILHGWEPTTSLEIGLSRTIRYFKKILESGNRNG
jgi:UDP-glucuronate decarboxylase